MRKIIILITCVSLCFTMHGRHRSASESRLTVKSNLFTKDTVKNNLDHKIPVWMKEYGVPCVGVGYIERGKVKWIQVYGETKKGIAAPENTIFNIASMTKPVVAMLTLKLVESGQWNLDEPLWDYWVDPDVADDPRLAKLTTRYVLSHQTGFPNWRWDKESKKLSFDFEPGTKYQYSGEGFVYLQKALEKKFNKSITQLADSLLFKPLKLKDTRFSWDKNIDESRFAFWHDSKGNLYEPATPKDRGVSAAGSLLTTIDDYSKLMIYVMNGANLSANIYNEMVKPQVNVKQHLAYGLGWEIVLDLPGNKYALEHGGSDMGVRTIGIMLPEAKQGILIFTNGDNGTFVFNNIIKESLSSGKALLNNLYQGDEIHEEVTLSDDVLNSYAGMYIQSNGKKFSLTKAGNSLKVFGDGVPNVVFFPEATDKFFLKDFNVQMGVFKDNENKSLKVIIYEEGNPVLEAVKIE